MKYKDINDYYLVDMICEGDDDSYGVLFNKYRPLIRNTSYSFYKRFKDFGYDFDDFIQEANVGFYKAIKYFNSNKNVLFYTFVSLCINRQLITFVNKISSKHAVLISYDGYDFDLLFNINIDLCDELFTDEMIKEVIFESDLEYSSVFELKINNFSYKEIQQLLGITFSQAEYRYKKMKELLKNKLTNYLNKKTE